MGYIFTYINAITETSQCMFYWMTCLYPAKFPSKTDGFEGQENMLKLLVGHTGAL